jgi:uncharacterized protein
MVTVNVEEIPEEGLSLSWEEEGSSLLSIGGDPAKVPLAFEGPVHAEARIERAGRSFLVRGTFKAVLRLQCSRCLDEFSYPLSTGFEVTLFPLKGTELPDEVELTEEEMESDFFEEGEILLTEMVWEQVLLEAPVQPLCKETCKGLCPVCGTDLNLSTCGCDRTGSESKFSALRTLKLD